MQLDLCLLYCRDNVAVLLYLQASQEFSPDGSGYLPMVSGTGGSSGIGNGQSSYKAYDHLEPPPAKFSAYDHLVPPEQSPYAALGGVGEVDLTSFAYQIASGMVGQTEAPNSITNPNKQEGRASVFVSIYHCVIAVVEVHDLLHYH